ncbi:hypothetical protein QTP88_027194 [Uroleucon formosanum]
MNSQAIDGWQTQTSKSKRNLSSSSSDTSSNNKTLPKHVGPQNKKLFTTRNRYEPLTQNEPTVMDTVSPDVTEEPNAVIHIKPPPPIFMKGILDFPNFCSVLIELIGVDNFFCKSAGDRLKIQTANPDSYRVLIRYLKESNAEYHTYQLREDKPLRVVIRNIHESTPTQLIKSELETRLFEVRQVSNVLHKTTKRPLPLFFVDLEPTDLSNDIYKLNSLLHTKIKVEEPYKPKVISQCNNCQEYGHTKTYCGYHSRCVRCGDHHQSSACPISRSDPPKCALCSGDHPASYKGCSVYRDLQRGRNQTSKNNFLSDNIRNKTSNVRDSHPLANSHLNQPSNHSPTYAQATAGQSHNPIPNSSPDLSNTITILAPPGPTYWPTSIHKNPDILDIFVAKIPNNLHCKTENLFEPNSDHSSVMLTVSASPLTRLESPKLFNSTTNKYKFHDLVNQQIHLNVKLKTTDDIDLAVNNLTKLIQSAAWHSTIKPQPSPHFPLIPEYIRSIIVEKRRARAMYQRTRLPSDKQKYNKLANYLKKVLAKHKSESLVYHLSNLSPKDGSLWRETKKICKYKSPNLPIKNPDGSFVISDPDKAELFKTHLSNIFQPHPDIISHSNTTIVNDYVNLPLRPSPGPVKHFTPNDIKFAISKYSLKKSPGFDLITAEVARCLPKKAIIHLSHIFNSVLRLSHFPILWKFSTIILVPKPNKPPDSISSFRPISLLPFFAKILEKLILKRLLPSIAENSIIPNSQFGFRTAHSTIQQVHRVVDAISYSLEKKLYCTSAFLDISQAFDRVWHDGLLFKLKKFLHPTYFLVIKSYLSDRNFQVRIGDAFSSIANISAGVPQGGILSPILYNIYASDQPTTPNTMVADYADDKAILSIHSDPLLAIQNLQTHLTLMEGWYTNWRFKINQSKSTHTTFTLRLAPCHDVYIYGTQIPSAPNTKYLGLILDKRLTWGQHIKSKRANLNLRLRLLKNLIIKNKHTDVNTKLIIYKSLLKPLWTYGLQLWGNAKKTNVNKIQTFQNIALRKLLNAPPYVSNFTIHSDLKMPLVYEEATSFYKRFHLRLASHPNPLARNLLTPTIPGNPPRRLKRKWCRDLLDR